MVLADTGGVEDADGSGCEVAAVAAVSCSICLEVVTDGGHRSWAKLQCGHEFHLDCIGSAFNIKGAMQCPNCRKIEKGQWLYANVSRPLPEFSFEDWAPDEDLYDLSYSEMSFGLHWCPFARIPASFDEGGFSSGAYHDFFGPHAVFAEHTPVSSTSHPCPYVSYFGSIHPSSSASSGSVADGSSFNHWTAPPSGPTEVHQHNPYAFQSMDLHYQNWDQNSTFNTSTRIGGPEQQHLIPPVAQRTVRNSSDIRRAGGMHPVVIGHSSTSRAPSSVTSSVLPTYSRSRDSPSTLQPYSQQSTGNPVGRAPSISMAWRSNSHRALPHMVEPNPAPPPVDQPSGFHILSTSASPASRAFHEAEIPHRDRFHHREPEHSQSLFPAGQLDRDSIWGPFCLPGVGPDGVIRSGSSRRRHGSDRMPSQNRP